MVTVVPLSIWIITVFKSLAKQGKIVAETMFLVIFPGVAKLENMGTGKQKCF